MKNEILHFRNDLFTRIQCFLNKLNGDSYFKGVRNHCAKMEFEGMKGTLCCCNDNNYCNRSSTNVQSSIFSVVMFAMVAMLIGSLSWQVQ